VTLIAGGHVALVVADVEAALGFYTGVLGLTLQERHGSDWVTVAGRGITIGLHPAGKHYPPPGTRGAAMIGFEVDVIEDEVARLKAKGVSFSGEIVRDPRAGAFANFADPDGNALYLWQVNWTS
jgi:predicted enzyme related to lactoylglutathione lyase